MADYPTFQHTKTDRIQRSDRERLMAADHALALVEAELRGLSGEDDELAYLMEVLRFGVQRALKAENEFSVPAVLEECSGQSH